MKYYLDVTRYKKDNYSLEIERMPIQDIDLSDSDDLSHIICLECYRKRKVLNDKAISSLIYNGIKKEKNGNICFKTNHNDEFYIDDFDTNLADIKKLIQDVRECDGIYAYFDKSINKEVTIKYLVQTSKKQCTIHEIKGIFEFASYFGYISLYNDNHIDFDSIYSICGENINYVNPFVLYSKIDYVKYFSLIETKAFSKEEVHTLKRR